jgi:filamentous hemagglutinin family protein
MTHRQSIGLIQFVLMLTGLLLGQHSPSSAQPVPDRTLGSENSSVIPRGGRNYDISGGARRGDNLFHSFSEFDVDAGGSVYFRNPAAVQNILSRVTGSNPSEILGTLGVRGNANFYLLNPNGIFFGPNARLDISGSFLATTGDRFSFPDGSEFSASNPQAPPLLTVNVPVGVQWGDLPAAIANSANLTVGRDLSLLGGSTTSSGKLSSLNGQVQLQAVSGGVQAQTIETNGQLVVVFAQDDIQLEAITTNGGDIAITTDAGSIFVKQDLITTNNNHDAGGMTLVAANDIQMGNIYAYGSNTQLNPSNGGSVSLTSNMGAIATGAIFTDGRVGGAIDLTSNAGDITIVGINTTLTNYYPSYGGGDVHLRALGNITTGSIATVGWQSGGNITIVSDGRFTIANSYAITTTFGSGDAGNINIQAQSITLRNGSAITASTRGAGRGGDITVRASGTLRLSGASAAAEPEDQVPSIIFTGSFASGDTGNVLIETEQLILRNGAYIAATPALNTDTLVVSTGQGGDVIVNADTIDVQGIAPDGIPSRIGTATLGPGNAGDLTINAQTISLQQGGIIATSTISQAPDAGRSGNLTINAEAVLIEGIGASGVPSALATDTFGRGDAGRLLLNSRRLVVQEGGAISTSSFYQGQGGELLINATESIELNGTSPAGFSSGLYAQTFAAGDAGDLIVATNRLTVRDRATISVASGSAASASLFVPNELEGFINIPPEATGQAGNLTITASQILLDHGSLTAETAGEGIADRAEIRLQGVDRLEMRNQSLISATARESANGGNIRIDADGGFVIADRFENSDIVARAERGNGGEINITAQSILGLAEHDPLTPFSDINASSEFGTQGTILLNTPDVDPNQGLVELPDGLLDISQQIVQSCSQHASEPTERFVMLGRGGLPATPQSVLNGEQILTEWVTLPEDSREADRTSNAVLLATAAPAAIAEANGWLVNPDGTVTLIASTSGQQIINTSADTGCH